MPSMQGTRSGTTRFDDLYWEASAEPIIEDDGELEKIVAQAELPVLLTAIAAALGDTSFLTSDLQPPLTLVDTQTPSARRHVRGAAGARQGPCLGGPAAAA